MIAANTSLMASPCCAADGAAATAIAAVSLFLPILFCSNGPNLSPQRWASITDPSCTLRLYLLVVSSSQNFANDGQHESSQNHECKKIETHAPPPFRKRGA